MTWHTTLDETDLYAICELYTEGSGAVELARQFRVRVSVINSVLAENGVQRKMKTANTPIECRLHDALRAAGIGFSTQKRLADRYVVDIVLHQAPVIIEADGATHRWKPEAQERDAIRDVVHELAGYRVFRFTGSEINTDAVACIQQVIDACSLVADEDPVFDIRTKFVGPDHPRYVGLHELTCQHCGETFFHRVKKRKYCSHEHYILGAVKGKPKSDYVKAALAESNRTRVWSDEARAKVSAARSGTKLTAEHRARIGAGVRAYQIMRESDLTRERESSTETMLPATLF